MSSNFAYEILQPDDLDEVISCGVSAFFNWEATSKLLGTTQEEMHHLITILYQKAFLEEGLSVVARELESNQIVGFAICKDFTSEIPEHLISQLPASLLPTLSLFEELEENYKAQHTIKPGELFHLLSLGVLEQFRLANIGTQLVLEAEHQAQKHHFKSIISELFSPISQHILLNKLDYEELYTIYFRDFEYQGKKVFSPITDFDGCTLVIKHL